MTPYRRFDTVSSVVSALVTLGGLSIAALIYAGDLPKEPTEIGGFLAIVAVLVTVVWLALQSSIVPFFLRHGLLRRIVLGRHNIEGTWIQIERGETFVRMAIIDFQPNKNAFILSGYSLNETLQVQAQFHATNNEISWPFMRFQFRNPLSNGDDGLSEGLGEIRFEMNRAAARRYNGYLQPVGTTKRISIEAVKLTNPRDIRAIRTLEGRRRIIETYRANFSPDTFAAAHSKLERAADELQALRFRRRATDTVSAELDRARARDV